MKKKMLFYFFLMNSIASAFSQPSIFNELKILKNNKLPWLSEVVNGKQPITTSLRDAVYHAPDMDTFEPEQVLPLSELPRDVDGNYILFPGVWEATVESYCLQAGTRRPSKGDGHSYAPMMGPKAELIRALLRNSEQHPDVEQKDIQVLLWAIIARTNVKYMPPEYLRTATRLLTPKQLLELNGGVLGVLAPEIEKKLYAGLPQPVAQILEAENAIRRKITSGTARYEELERIAMQAGIATPEQTLYKKSWSLHPQDYYIQYDPEGYARTTIRVYLPEHKYPTGSIRKVATGSLASSSLWPYPFLELKKFDSSDGLAIPGGPGQRLGQSPRRPPKDKDNGKDGRADKNNPIEKARRVTGVMQTASNAMNLYGDGLRSVPGINNPFDPSNLAGNLVTWILDNGQKICNGLRMDPPDPNFKTYAKLGNLNLPLPPSSDGSEIEKAALQFSAALVKTYDVLHAAIESIDKHGGALLAKDHYWVQQQARAIIYYKKMSGPLLNETCQKWEEYINALRQAGISHVPLTPDKLIAYQEAVRDKGFSVSQLEAFQLLQLSPAQINQYKQQILAVNPDSFRGEIIQNWKNAVQAFREVAIMYTNFPAITPPWED